MHIVQTVLKPFGSTTIIQGRVTALQGNNLDIETAAGRVLLQCNHSTRLAKLIGIGLKGLQFRDVSISELQGHYCICRIMVYSLPSTCTPRRHTLFSLISFGCDCKELFGDPDFHCNIASWLANFWLISLDSEEGGIFANILNGGARVQGPEIYEKWSYITSRAVAGFSFAFQLTGRKEYLHSAAQGMDFLKKSAHQIKDYLFFRSRQMRNGAQHPDTVPLLNIFVHEYALTGPLRYLAAASDTSTRSFIIQGLESIMCFHDSINRGFFDALDITTLRPINGLTSTKSFTSSVDLLAAAIIFAKELECVSPSCDPRSVSVEICELVLRHHLIEGKPFIIESLNSDWTPNSSTWRNEYATVDIAGNCGATAKVARVLAVSLPLLPPALSFEAQKWVKKILDGLLSLGAWDPLRGGVYDVMERNSPNGQLGEFLFHGDFVWWTQEQLCLAAYLGFLLFGDHHYLEVARSILRFWICCFMAPRGGVYDTVDHAGNPVSTHMGSWLKSSYHELEFAYFTSIFEAIINERPITLYFAPKHTGPYTNALPDIGVVQWKVLDKQILPNGVIAVQFKSIPIPQK